MSAQSAVEYLLRAFRYGEWLKIHPEYPGHALRLPTLEQTFQPAEEEEDDESDEWE